MTVLRRWCCYSSWPSIIANFAGPEHPLRRTAASIEKEDILCDDHGGRGAVLAVYFPGVVVMLDIEKQILEESKRYYEDGDLGGLINVAEIHRGTTEDFPFYNNLLWRLFGLVWNLPEGNREVSQILQILAESYHDFILRLQAFVFGQIDVGAIRSRIPYRKAPARPAFLINSFMPRNSAGSDALLTYCRHLADTAGQDPCMINVHYYPAVDKMPILHTNRIFMPIRVEPGWHTHGLPGETRIPVYVTANGPGLGMEKIVEVLRLLIERQADVVVGHAGFNIIADLVAPLWPVVCMESSRSEAVSFAHAFLSLGPSVTYFVRNRPDLYAEPREVVRMSAAFPIAPRKGVYSRAELGFADDDYVAVLVGYRLNEEMDADFVAFLIEALTAIPRLRFVFAGIPTLRCLPALPEALRRRCTVRGLEAEMRDLVAHCDCYVNTQRLGGGGSALVALAEGLPVLTLPGGDVGGVVGVENCLPDLVAVRARLERLAADPVEQAAACAAAAAIYAQWDFADNIALVRRSFRAARRIFDATDAQR